MRMTILATGDSQEVYSYEKLQAMASAGPYSHAVAATGFFLDCHNPMKATRKTGRHDLSPSEI